MGGTRIVTVSSRRPLASALVVLALAGCSTAPAESESTSELDEFEARIRGEFDATSDPYLVEIQERIAACMAEAGFEYTPQIPRSIYRYSTPEVLTREHAAQFGYGHTTQPAPGVAPDKWGQQIGDLAGEEENMAYRGTLSPEALEAYWEAMAGPDTEEPSVDAPPQGCHNTAVAAALADAQTPDAFREVERAIRDVWLAIDGYPRVAALVGPWSDCMADAGYPGFTDFGGGINHVIETGNAFPAPADMLFEEIAEVYATELAEIQQQEIDVALADVACRESVDYDDVRRAVREELHERLVETYREDLEAWAQWAEERRAGQE